MSDMAPEDDFVRITLRIPARLHQQLNEAAAKKRSMNAEIIARLEESFEGLGVSNWSYEMETLSRMADESIQKSPYFERIFEKVAVSAAQKAASHAVSSVIGILTQGSEVTRNSLIAEILYKNLDAKQASSMTIRGEPREITLSDFSDVLRAAGPELAKQVTDKIHAQSIDNAKLDQIIADFVGGTKAASTRERHTKLISELEALVSQPDKGRRALDLDDKPAAEGQPTQSVRSRRVLPGLTDDTPSTPKRPSRAR